ADTRIRIGETHALRHWWWPSHPCRRQDRSEIPQPGQPERNVGWPRIKAPLADSRTQIRKEAGALRYFCFGQDHRGQEGTPQGSPSREEIAGVSAVPRRRIGK